jgi:hypothetical protein
VPRARIVFKGPRQAPAACPRPRPFTNDLSAPTFYMASTVPKGEARIRTKNATFPLRLKIYS